MRTEALPSLNKNKDKSNMDLRTDRYDPSQEDGPEGLVTEIKTGAWGKAPNKLSVLDQLPSQEHENHDRNLNIKRDKIDLLEI
jgi:hypothetical protein